MHAVDRITVKTRVHTEDPHVPSVTNEWPTANHQEREVYDMFGVVFHGHPDLRRILMPEDYEGHPQRRDFPIGGEPVLFTHNETKSPGVVQVTDVTEPHANAASSIAAPSSPRTRARSCSPSTSARTTLPRTACCD